LIGRWKKVTKEIGLYIHVHTILKSDHRSNRPRLTMTLACQRESRIRYEKTL
ncbi:unnamed protein product, partial [marine sediment metagenome]